MCELIVYIVWRELSCIDVCAGQIWSNLDDWKYAFQSIEYGIIGMVLHKTLQYILYRITVCKYVATEDWANNLLIWEGLWTSHFNKETLVNLK